MKVTIITGPIQSGKSTRLKTMLDERKDVGGFLSIDIHEKRYLFDANKKVLHDFQVNELDANTISIGRFHFLKSAFDSASAWTLTHLADPNIHTIVIDEIGKLELKDEGFAPLVKSILHYNSEKEIIFVIRDYLLGEVIEKFGLSQKMIFENKNP